MTKAEYLEEIIDGIRSEGLNYFLIDYSTIDFKMFKKLSELQSLYRILEVMIECELSTQTKLHLEDTDIEDYDIRDTDTADVLKVIKEYGYKNDDLAMKLYEEYVTK